MAYMKDYKNSPLLKEELFKKFIDKILNLEAGKRTTFFFCSEGELNKRRHQLYSFLNSLERKKSFALSKSLHVNRGWALEVLALF